MIGFGKKKLFTGGHRLSVAEDTVCAIAGTHYKIGGTWVCNSVHNGAFYLDGLGKITNLINNITYLLLGGSSLSVSAACKVYYMMYKNGAFLFETPHDFTSSSKIGFIGTNGKVDVNKGDYFEVYVRTDVNSVTVTSHTLMLSFWGDR